LIAIALAGAAVRLFPVFHLPAPTGPHDVGYRNFHFIDESRPETFTPDPHDRREVSMQIWYPSNGRTTEATKPYLESAKEADRAIAGFFSIPRYLNTHLGLVKTHSFRDAPLTEGSKPFPVIIFNHGFSAVSINYTTLVEELASHGYIVIGVGHAFETPFFPLPGGRILPFDPHNEAYRARIDEYESGTWWDSFQGLLNAHDPILQERFYKEHLATMSLQSESTRIWADDISFVVDHLAQMNRAGPFADGMDVQAIGCAGHSMGGAACGQVAITDNRVKAGINLDGGQWGDLIDSRLTTPFMFVYSEQWGEEGFFNEVFATRSESLAYQVLIRGTLHRNLSDASIVGGLPGILGNLGDIDGDRCVTVLRTYMRAFYDRHLKGLDSPFLERESADFPEVLLRITDNRVD
jgi:pimeloyl-ACP methyl ester carboxylesterase